MKHTLLLVLCSSMIVTIVDAQDILGKWYSIEKDGRFAEIAISRDSLKMQAVDFELKPMDYETVNRIHSGTYPVGNKVLLIHFNKENSTYSALTTFNIKPRQSFEIATNGIGKVTGNKEELIELSKKDTTKLITDMLVYSEHYVPYLKTLKNVDLMSIDDFKALLRTFILRKAQYQNAEGAINSVMMFRGMSRILVEMSYNPLIDMAKLNGLFRNFSSDAEVMELRGKLK